MAMELSGLPNAAAWLATIVVLLLLGHHLHRRRAIQLPPGPRPWPIIGNLNLVGPLFHRSIHALPQKYGPIMHVWFGSNPVVVRSSAELAKEFLKTHDATLAGRPKFAAGNTPPTTTPTSHVLSTAHTDDKARRMFLTELFNPKRIESYEYIIREELKVFLRELYNSANKTID